MNRRNYRLASKILAMTLFLTCIWINAFSQEEKSAEARQAVDRALITHGSKLSDGSLSDWVGRGQIRITGDEGGPRNFTVAVKGRSQMQRVVEMQDGTAIRFGTDGKQTWQSAGLFKGNAAGRAAELAESLTNRSIASLFSSDAHGRIYRDLGSEKKDFVPESLTSHAIEVEDEKGKATRYYIDNKSHLISRLEFDTGEYFTLPFGEEKYPLVAAYVFSDYRPVDGVMTPFRIEVYQGLIKIEEMTFESIEYNTGLTDDMFIP
ncbi:MAG: hypothetical protein QUT30_07575 [Acidobacteriota bacterium]|nr:hypothetical protein [Acidobacteriota bacterium]